MRQKVFMASVLALCACALSESDTGAETGSDDPPLFQGPFEYRSQYDGRHYIDTLWMLSEQAQEDIAELGKTPEEYLDWRIDAMNDTLVRSLVDTSIVRSLGSHVITAPDMTT